MKKVCPDTHTLCPEGYVAWHEWADKKSKTHDSTQCPTCKLWTIWKPKKSRSSPRSNAGEVFKPTRLELRRPSIQEKEITWRL